MGTFKIHLPSPPQAVESLYLVIYLRSWRYLFKNFHRIFTGSQEISSESSNRQKQRILIETWASFQPVAGQEVIRKDASQGKSPYMPWHNNSLENFITC
jgi:hypothetical protein